MGESDGERGQGRKEKRARVRNGEGGRERETERKEGEREGWSARERGDRVCLWEIELTVTRAMGNTGVQAHLSLKPPFWEKWMKSEPHHWWQGTDGWLREWTENQGPGAQIWMTYQKYMCAQRRPGRIHYIGRSLLCSLASFVQHWAFCFNSQMDLSNDVFIMI